MANENRIPTGREVKGPKHRLRTMEVFDLVGDKSEVFVTLSNKRDVTQARTITAEKIKKSLANISPWAKDKLK